MHVIATAGHVDHGKSTLVRALTGVDPDRLEEERRRGLSISLGYCWTELPGAGEVAFVDVPGHERFVSTMLSGIGPVPAALLVVAADDPWMPQAAEHLAALDALGVCRGIIAITRSDLADPAPALARVRAEVATTTLRDAPAVVVSGRTGAGLDELRERLVALVRSLPEPPPDAPVRLWLDRVFSIKGAGTVVTGTLPEGTVRAGDTLQLGHRGTTVRVRAVQTLDRPVDAVSGVARVALNVLGAGVEELREAAVLLTPDAWHLTDVVDVRLTGPVADLRPGSRPLLHLGATSVSAHLRPLAGDLVRLTTERALPLRIGDRALLRDPGSRALWGVRVLDPAPPKLTRRGSAVRRAEALAHAPGHAGAPSPADEIARRGTVRLSLLRRIGVPLDTLDHREAGGATSGGELSGAPVVAGDWALSPVRAQRAREQLVALLEDHARTAPLERGMPVAAVAHELDLPTPDLVGELLVPPLRLVEGRVQSGDAVVLPAALEQALTALADDLAGAPFAAPTADRLAELGLDARSISAAVKAGRLLRLADGIVLLPGTEDRARGRLATLPQPFTTSEARVSLETSRRVALPLLAHLDRTGVTLRLPDDRRQLR